MDAAPPLQALARKVAVLPSAVADQIAAGEVVERPASAVKELVENALDAGATVIDIDVEEGGRALIRVSDNGSGMDRDDATLALERHATSKIRRIGDLVGVTTFGFRGEALPAICSVSQVTLETATADGAGTIIRAAGGTIESVTDGTRRRGTTVTVNQLFYNTPARRKFLRSARSEWRAIAELLTTIALSRWGIHLSVTHDGKRLLSFPPATTLRERIGAVWGAAYARRFLDVDAVSGPIRVHGLAERPADVGTATRRVTILVNGRAVRDNGILRAMEAAYRSALAPGLRPSGVLLVDVPADTVDVNVHPAKAEVRFHDRWTVERAVEHAVRRALGTLDAAAALGRSPMTWSPRPPAEAVPITQLPPSRPSDSGPLFTTERGGATSIDGDAVTDDASPPPLTVPPLVQLRRTYILCESDDGVILIDQHSAHERVLYERFASELAAGRAPSQRLLFPATLHLNPDEAEAADVHRGALEQLGFELDGFGGHSLIVHAVPAPHARFDALQCLRETLAQLAGDRVPSTHARHERLLATMACKAAVKAGDALSSDEMRALYMALAGATLPAHDVHGRSTIVRLTWDELERRFGRR